MLTHFIEAGNEFNWGKFVVAHFDPEEWHRSSGAPFGMGNPGSLLRGRGWDPAHHTFVMDLQTGEGAMFSLGGYAKYDLEQKHNIWTCPLFPHFLEWLYVHYRKDPVNWFDTLPAFVEISTEVCPPSMVGQRGDHQQIHN